MKLEVYKSVAVLAEKAAEKIAVLASIALDTHGRCSLVLSGGSTPRSVYEILGSARYRNRVDWQRTHLFWGDERCVAPHMPESNFRMVKESLLQHIEIPESHIHRIRVEHQPAQAALLYEAEIAAHFTLKPGAMPPFDILLLGMGEDGHTASLFPGTTALDVTTRSVVDLYVDRLRSHRVTVTFPVINKAHNVIVLVSGMSKAPVLRKVLEDKPGHYPIERVNPASGNLYWLVDHEAASQLTTVEVR